MCGNNTLPKSQRLPKGAVNGQVPKWNDLLKLWVASYESGADPNLMSEISDLIDQKIDDSIINNLLSQLTDKSLSANQGYVLNNAISDLSIQKQNVLGFTPENVVNKNAANGYLGLDGNSRASADSLINLINDGLSTAGSRTWSIDQIKGYVSGLVDTLIKIAEAFTPDGSYPETYAGESIMAGDSFRCGAGFMGMISVGPEDLLIATVDNPGQTDSNWMVIEGNRDQATESVMGIARLVQQSDVETTDLTDNLRIVTVLRLAQWWAWIKANVAQTWGQMVTFSQAPKFSSATAGQYLKVDEDQRLVSVSVIPVTDISDAESLANKVTNLDSPNDTTYPTTKTVNDAIKNLAINFQLSTYTLVITDSGKMIDMNNAGANDIHIPENGSVPFPIGTQIMIAQYGEGQTTIVPEGGVNVRTATGMKLANQYAGATLVKRDINEWYLFGNLTA